jgi:hypothetical protein
MLYRRLKAITTLAALAAILAIGGAPALPSVRAGVHKVNANAPATTTEPYWLYDSPDCALLTAPVLSSPSEVHCGYVTAARLLLPTHFEDFPHYTRPPPAI